MRSLSLILAAAVAACTFYSGSAAVPSSDPSTVCTGTPNTFATTPNRDPPVFINSSGVGALYKAGYSGDEGPPLLVLHLWGDNPYDQGVAYGTLLKSQITTLYSELNQWVESELNKVNLSPEIKAWIEDHGVPFLLNMTAQLTAPYTPPRYTQMIAGIASAIDMPAWRVASFVMIPQAIQASCSMAGMWADALPADTTAALLQLRALDWDTSGPFQQFPLLTTYHIDSGYPGGGHTFSSLGWTGLIGTLTGMSSAGIGISEKVFAKYPLYKDTWVGKPWHFMLEDVLLYAQDSDEALSAIASANRTAGIFIGVGQATGAETNFRALQTTDKFMNVWNAINFPAYPPAHPLLSNTVFLNKHEQPSNELCMGALEAAALGGAIAADVRFGPEGGALGDLEILQRVT